MTVGTKVKQTLETLKSAQGTLKIYAEQTKSKEESEIYEEAINITNQILGDLDLRIKTLEQREPDYKGN